MGWIAPAPICIDLFTGLHGWSHGFLAEGWRVIGFDLYDKCRESGMPRPEGDFELVLQDVSTLDGRQFAGAAAIVASPPCQAYSYRAMPWKRAKALPPPDNTLFDACFRIQREASEAAGRHIPMVIENVCGAQKWVGRAAWHYGSYYLWGDVPALMPFMYRRKSEHEPLCETPNGTGKTSWFFGNSKGEGRYYGYDGVKNRDSDGYERDHPNAFGWKKPRSGSHSKRRAEAAAIIAKIPFDLAAHIARCFYPRAQKELYGTAERRQIERAGEIDHRAVQRLPV